MKILVNYQKSDQSHLPILQYHLKNRNLQAIATNLTLSAGELVAKAQNSGCQAILLCNPDTLQQCVPGVRPSLDLYRGSLLNFSVPTIVCNSLTHTTSIDHGTWLLGKDLDKFSTLSKAYKVPFSFTLLENQEDFKDAFNVLSSSDCISYDIETRNFNFPDSPKEEDRPDDYIDKAGDTLITCASYTAISRNSELQTFVVPFIDFAENHYVDPISYGNALLFLRKANALQIPKVMHNGLYDCLHSITYHAEPINWTLDTMAMAHSEFSSLPKTLDFVASITLPDYMQWKPEAEASAKQKDIHAYWNYNAKDTWYTARILLHYLRNLPAYAKKNYATLFPLVYPSLYGAFEGLKIDQDKRKELRAKAKTEVEKALFDLRTMLANPSFNPGSPKQVQQYVYDIFGAVDPHIGLKRDAKTGKRSRMERGTDEKNLSAIGGQHPLLLLLTSSILNYRGAKKAISNYFDFTQLNGRLLWNLNPFGTDSGRMSCNASSFWCGTQVQNIPYYAKGLLIADEGYALVEFDNSQSEARCTAYLAQDLDLIAALENPLQDFYRSLGTLFFGIPYPEVTTELRNAVLKKIVHGTNYVMGAQTFIENAGIQNLLKGATILGISISLDKKPPPGSISLKAFATMLLDSYHKPFFRVREWYKEVVAEVSTTHMLVSPLGYTRYFFGDISKNHNLMRSAVAHAPQNLSVMILNKGLMKFWERVKASKGQIRFKAQIHDSIFAQIKTDILTETIPLIQQDLYNPIQVHNRTLIIPVDYKHGKSWGTMEEVKTPRS